MDALTFNEVWAVVACVWVAVVAVVGLSSMLGGDDEGGPDGFA